NGACRMAETLRAGREGVFWLRLRAVCLAAAGQESRADLTAQLARSEGASPQFERAYALALLEAGRAPDEQVETADPLEFAAAVRAGANIRLSAAPPRAMLVPPREDEGALAVLRAKQAAELSFGTTDAAAAAYAAYRMTDEADDAIDDGMSRLDVALDAAPGAKEALLYQMAVDPRAAPELRTQALAASLESAETPAAFIAAARIPLRALPEDAGRDDALLFASAAAAGGDAAQARRWLTVAAEPPAPPAPAADPDSGAPVPLGVAPPWSPPNPDDVAAVEALVALYAEAPDAAVSRLQGKGDPDMRFIDALVLDALGKSAEPDLGLAFLRGGAESGRRADPNVLLAMEAAAQSGAA